MKLPFSLKKLTALKGAFARLNPAPVFGKLGKLAGKLNVLSILKKTKKKKQGEEDDLDEGDFLPSSEEDVLGDLGDLDALDAEAAARQAEDGEADESDFGPTESPDDMDEMTSTGEVLEEPDAFADLEGEDESGAAAEAGEELDLSGLEDMPDFDEEDLDEEDEQAGKKKLALLAGGGVTLAVLIGAGAWLFLGAESEPEPPQTSGVVLNLDDVPLAGRGTPLPDRESPPDRAPEGAAPGGEGQVDGGLTPPTPQGTMGSPALPENEVDRTLAQLGLDAVPEPGVGVVVPAVTQASFAKVPAAPAGTALSPQPVPSLIQQTDVGLLPKIAEDGLTPFDAYARPIPQGGDPAKPKVAIIVTGLGMSRAATEATISSLPQDVTLALDIYARGLDFWVNIIRDDGHEVLLSLPLESNDFPFVDPGPDALQVLASPEENVRKLEYILSRTTGYFGVLANHGGKFLAAEDQVKTIMEELQNRGIMYVDSGAEGSLGSRAAYGLDMPWATVEMNLDEARNDAELRAMLAEFEALARKRAIAVARISPTPLALARLNNWVRGLEASGFELVPVSALAKKQLIR